MQYLWHGSRKGAIRRRAAGGNQGWERGWVASVTHAHLRSENTKWKNSSKIMNNSEYGSKISCCHVVLGCQSFLCADCPSWTCQLSVSHLGVSLVSYCCLNKVFLLKELVFYFLMAPKCKSSDVGHFYMPKRKPWSVSWKERNKIT